MIAELRPLGCGRECPLRLVIMLALMWAVAGCGELPKPFQPDSKLRLSSQQFDLKPSAGMTVTVLPESPLDPDAVPLPVDMAAALQQRLATALQNHDIVAYAAVPQSGTYRLELVPAAAAGFTARLVDPQNKDAFVQALPPTRLTAATAKTIAQQYAAALAPAIRRFESGGEGGNQENGTAAQSLPLPPVSITAITGAPGDGEQSLARAMARALYAYSIPVVSPPTAVSHLLAADIQLSKQAPAREYVRIIWRLSRPDGMQLGEVRQENVIPQGTLDGEWGAIAGAIADSSAPELVALLRAAQ